MQLRASRIVLRSPSAIKCIGSQLPQRWWRKAFVRGVGNAGLLHTAGVFGMLNSHSLVALPLRTLLHLVSILGVLFSHVIAHHVVSNRVHIIDMTCFGHSANSFPSPSGPLGGKFGALCFVYSYVLHFLQQSRVCAMHNCGLWHSDNVFPNFPGSFRGRCDIIGVGC